MDNKVIVITGASRGLGKSLAEILVKNNAKVVISSRDNNELNTVAKTINATAVVADVTKESNMKSLVQTTLDKFGKIDVLINNAGIWLPKAPVEDIDMDKAHQLFEVNLFGTVYATRSVLPQMKKQGNGLIINVVSSAALSGRPNQSIYSSSKHAVKGFTDSIREELKDSSIKVVGIYPGGIKTHLFDEKPPADYDDFMTPEFVAEKIVDHVFFSNLESDLILKRPGQK